MVGHMTPCAVREASPPHGSVSPPLPPPSAPAPIPALTSPVRADISPVITHTFIRYC